VEERESLYFGGRELELRLRKVEDAVSKAAFEKCPNLMAAHFL
jgi:hypothetical protein